MTRLQQVALTAIAAAMVAGTFVLGVPRLYTS
jgi:hypothetical protein